MTGFDTDQKILSSIYRAGRKFSGGKSIAQMAERKGKVNYRKNMRFDCAAPSKRHGAFTLVEVVISIAITASVFGSILICYSQAARRAQWSGYSLAAQAMTMQQIERARSAVWDPAQTQVGANGRNDILNLVGTNWAKLDLPMSGTNYVIATNYVTVQMIQTWSGTTVSNQLVRVDTVWPFRWGTTVSYFTNTTCTYCAPDNRADNTF